MNPHDNDEYYTRQADFSDVPGEPSEDTVEDEPEEEKSSDPTDISNFNPEFIHKELEVQLELTQKALQAHLGGVSELEQAVALLEVALERIKDFRTVTDDYDWSNEHHEYEESYTQRAYDRLQLKLKERKQAQQETGIGFAVKGLQALKENLVALNGGYDSCWYGHTHPFCRVASSMAGYVRRTMQERDLLPEDWSSWTSMTPIEKWGAIDPERVRAFLLEELPKFIEKHS